MFGAAASFVGGLAYLAEGDRINGGIASGAAILGVCADAGIAGLDLKGAVKGRMNSSPSFTKPLASKIAKDDFRGRADGAVFFAEDLATAAHLAGGTGRHRTHRASPLGWRKHCSEA